MNIPNRVNPVSFDVSLPKGYMHLDFLESTGTQWIDTGVYLSSESEVRCEYLLTKIVEGANQYLFDTQTRIDGTFTQFGFTLYNMTHTDSVYGYVRTGTAQQIKTLRPEGKTSITLNKKGLTINDVFLNVGIVPDEFILPLTCYLFADNFFGNVSSLAYVRVYSFSISRAGEMQVDYVPCISPDGKLGMYNKVDGSLKENVGTGQFIAGMTLPQARGLSLPAGGGELTLSLPYEASVDRMVQEALEAARLNGWTLTVQYRDGELPAGWYRSVSFLESTGEQYIDTGIKLCNESEVRCEFLVKEWSQQNNYIWGTGGIYLYAFNVGDTNNSEGRTCYIYKAASTLYWSGGVAPYGEKNTLHAQALGTSAEGTLNGVERTIATIEAFETEQTCAVFARKDPAYVLKATAPTCFYSFSISRAGVQQCNLIPCIDAEGIPVMWDSVQKKALYNAGSGQFIVGLETVEDVRAFLLPPFGGELTLSLPHEASIDRLAQAALERARANGWTLQLQYAEAEVPAGYRRLDFLESTGTQYIDTGVKLSNESEVRCEMMITQNRPDGNTQAFFGVFGSPTFRAYLINEKILAINAGENKNDLIAHFDNFEVDEKCKLRVTNSKTYLNERQSMPYELVPFETSDACHVFSANTLVYTYWSYARIYSFSISRAGEMQVDYVPCISPEGKLGMYNKVDGTMKENAGSSPFIAGLATVDDVRKLWLPETGGELTVSVPADTPDSVVEQLRKNNPTWQIAVQFRTENNEN